MTSSIAHIKEKVKKVSVYIIPAALIFFIFLSIYQLVITGEKIRYIDTRIKIKQAELNRKEQSLINEQSNITLREELLQTAQSLKESISPKPDVHKQILKMDALIEENNLKPIEFIKSHINSSSLANGQPIYFTRFTISTRGSLLDTMSFIEGLSNASTLYHLNDFEISISIKEQNNTLLKFNANVYYKENRKSIDP